MTYRWPMTFDEITQVLEESTPDDWYEVPLASGWDSFVWTLAITTFGGDRRQVIEVEGHYSRAVYCDNPDLGLAWGLKSQDEFTEPWTQAFADKTASSQYVDVLWNGMLIDRFVHVVVDGGRSAIPLPDREMVANLVLGYSLKNRDYRVGRLVASISGRTELKTFDEYIKRVGIVLEEGA
jgi:hypothetical protein